VPVFYHFRGTTVLHFFAVFTHPIWSPRKGVSLWFGVRNLDSQKLEFQIFPWGLVYEIWSKKNWSLWSTRWCKQHDHVVWGSNAAKGQHDGSTWLYWCLISVMFVWCVDICIRVPQNSAQLLSSSPVHSDIVRGQRHGSRGDCWNLQHMWVLLTFFHSLFELKFVLCQAGGVVWSFVLSFLHSFCEQDNSQTH